MSFIAATSVWFTGVGTPHRAPQRTTEPLTKSISVTEPFSRLCSIDALKSAGNPSPALTQGSRGSVIPRFVQLIKEGKPLTVTDPKMTRFMMSIDDAVDLVIYAYQHGNAGDVFVQKAPAATIETLALALKKLFDAPNPIQVIGTRLPIQ